MPVCRKPMSGWQETMFSPSNSSKRRSTPWVEGCCGPMLSTMRRPPVGDWSVSTTDRKSTRLNSSHLGISYAVFCLKKKKQHLKSSHLGISYAVFCLKHYIQTHH